MKEVRGETQGRDLEAGSEAKVMEECRLQAYFPWFAMFNYLHISGSPAQGCPQPQWAGIPSTHTSIINQKNARVDLPGDQAD